MEDINLNHANAIRKLSEAVVTLASAIETGRIDGVLEEVASALYGDDDGTDVTKN